MIGAVMALAHLHRLGAERERHHLMAEADAEGRHAPVEQFGDDGHGIFAGLGGIAGPVRQEDAVGLERQNVFGARRRRHDRHGAAGIGEEPQDVALDAIVDGDDVVVRLALRRP